MRRSLPHATLTIALMFAAPAGARGVSPYLPTQLAPEIERDIERVLILADAAVLARPIPAARVLDALPKACAHDAQLCERVRRFLQRYMDKRGLAHASVEVATSSGVEHPAPNSLGMKTDSAWRVSTSGYAQFGDYILVSGGAVAYDGTGDAIPTGSMLSIGVDYAQLDIGFREHWLSPMTDSSMLIGANAETMPSATLSNYQPITGLGLRYEVFLAQMARTLNIAHQGGTTQGRPNLAGMHLSIEPVSGWSLGGNRIMQFGGGERGGRSLGDFLDALFQPRRYDNASESLNSDQEFGNQAAAWTSRMIFPGHVPFSVYFEFAGEDTSYSGIYRLGNSALSMGIDIPRLWSDFNLTYEVSEWQNGWYVHGIYGDGLTNEGRSIGHWFGDARVYRDGVGGQSHMLRLGWQPKFGGAAEARYRTLKNELYTGYPYERAHEVMLRYSYPLRAFLVGGEVTVGRDVFGEDYSRVAAFARFGGDFSATDGGGAYPHDSRDNGVDYFVDAGGSASRARIELSDGTPKYVTAVAYAPHIAVGARRRVGENSDLGARIEFDRFEDELLISVRALDYRYRFANGLAMTFFAGASRYDLATPAFGYYGGLGAQWRNLLPNIDLSLDIRYGDKFARDKLLPDDPPEVARPDIFYDLMGATLYFSYRL